MCLYSCIGPVPVDVVMVDNELYFVLDQPYEIEFLRVSAAMQKGKPGASVEALWLLGHDTFTEVKKRKHPKLKQIRYGQKFEEFSRVEGPGQLQKNVEYLVEIKMVDVFARESFIIDENNKVIMPHPSFARQKNRTYSVTVDKNGNKTLVSQSHQGE